MQASQSQQPGLPQGQSPQQAMTMQGAMIPQGQQPQRMLVPQQPGARPQTPQRPGAIAPNALQDLLRTLRSPSSPQQQQQVLNILKSNPQLMAAFIKQRAAKYHANQPPQQQQAGPQQADPQQQPGMPAMQAMLMQVGGVQRPGMPPQQPQQPPPQGMAALGPQGQLMNPAHNPNPQMVKWGLGLDDDSNSQSGEASKSPQDIRRLSIQRCIQSLVHACQCRNTDCSLPSCQKMKRVVQHIKGCKRKTNGGCPICKQLIALCCYHAKHCQEVNKCPVPLCPNIKHKLRQQQLQRRLQQARVLRRRMQQMVMKEQATGCSTGSNRPR